MSEGPECVQRAAGEVRVSFSAVGASPAHSDFPPYLVPPVKGDLFHVGDDAWVHEAKIAFLVCLLGHQLAKFRWAGFEHAGRGVDDEAGQQRGPDGVGAPGARRADQGVGGEHHIQDGLGEVGVEVCHRLWEHHDVLSEGLVGVGQPPVHADHSVVGLVGEVGLVGVIHQARAEGKGQLALQVPDGAVDERGRDGDHQPFDQLDDKAPGLFLHDALHDLPVEGRHINGEEGPGNQRDRVEAQQAQLGADQLGEEQSAQLQQLFQELRVDRRRRSAPAAAALRCSPARLSAAARPPQPPPEDGVEHLQPVRRGQQAGSALRGARAAPLHPAGRRAQHVGHRARTAPLLAAASHARQEGRPRGLLAGLPGRAPAAADAEWALPPPGWRFPSQPGALHNAARRRAARPATRHWLRRAGRHLRRPGRAAPLVSRGLGPGKVAVGSQVAGLWSSARSPRGRSARPALARGRSALPPAPRPSLPEEGLGSEARPGGRGAAGGAFLSYAGVSQSVCLRWLRTGGSGKCTAGVQGSAALPQKWTEAGLPRCDPARTQAN